MDFQSPEEPERRTSGRLKPPPNYFSRAVQFKLMMLVGSLLLVIVLMYEARKPETWYFMGFQQEGGESTEGEGIDTRALVSSNRESVVAPAAIGQEEADDLSSEAAQPGTLVDDEDLQPLQGESLADTLLSKTRRDFWGELFDRMDSDSRQIWFIGLREGRRELPLAGSHLESWRELIADIGRERVTYQNNILRAIANLELSDVQKREAWTEVLQEMQGRWTEIEDALEGVEAGTNAMQASTLIDLQLLFDQVALERISDDHLGSRRQEREIWYRQFERLANWSAGTRGAKPLADPFYANDQAVDFEPVGFVQLFKQPDAYRGRRVKIVGKVKLVEYQPAPENDYGIEGYHVMWVRPEGKTNSPIVVYALRLPAGFPPYDEQGRLEFERGKLAPVSIDALFFKRWAYEAGDGVRLCPLLVGLEPDWMSVDEMQEQSQPLPSLPTMLGVIAVIAVAAFGIARFALRSATQIETPGFKMPQRADAESPDQIGQGSRNERSDPFAFRGWRSRSFLLNHGWISLATVRPVSSGTADRQT